MGERVSAPEPSDRTVPKPVGTAFLAALNRRFQALHIHPTQKLFGKALHLP